MSSTFTKASQLKLKIDRLSRIIAEIGPKLSLSEEIRYRNKLISMQNKLNSILGVK